MKTQEAVTIVLSGWSLLQTIYVEVSRWSQEKDKELGKYFD